MSNIKTQINNSTFKNTLFYNDNEVDKLLGNVPIRPDIFFGRDNSTKEIHKKLQNENHLLLLINGIGGIGKTTLASQYYFEYINFYSHLIWVMPEKGIKKGINSLATSLKLSLEKNLSEDEQVIEVLRSIANLKKPILLIIDNANNLDDLDRHFSLLRIFQDTHILITTRIENYQHVATYKINQIDKKSANALFKYHFASFKLEEQEILDKVLEAVDYNTLVIELLAKNLNKFNNDLSENYPIQKLLEDIQLKGVLKISKSATVESDYKLQNAKPEEIIRTMYDISNLTIEEKEILYVFAFLPTISVNYDELYSFLPRVKELDRKLLSLSQKGWIDYDKENKSFKVHPIIAETAREKIKPLTKISKRLFDIFFSFFAIFIVSPFILIIAILVKLEDGGPIFFKRRGSNIKGKVFGIFYFRTMVVNAEELLKKMLAIKENKYPPKLKGDPRITNIGKYLRKYSLNSLPVFFNVLIGDMSLVGPSPFLYVLSESPQSFNKIVKLYAKPGITSLSLVKGYEGNFETDITMKNRIKYDIYYIENWSIFLDLKIIFLTAWRILKPLKSD